MTFTLDQTQQKKLSEWLRAQYQDIGEKQLAMGMNLVHRCEDGTVEPYFGAIGGQLTYQFSPTNLGVVTVVILCKGTEWERNINLTDYDMW